MKRLATVLKLLVMAVSAGLAWASYGTVVIGIARGWN